MSLLKLDEFTESVTITLGGRLLVGDDDNPLAWVTVTTAFNTENGRYVMTCGHERGTRLISGETRATIAELAVNLLDEPDPVDMAIYRLTDLEVRVLRPHYHADRVDHPQPGPARVYTAHGGRLAQVLAVEANPAGLQALIGASQPLIACDLGLVDGDSGAPLHQLGAAGTPQLVGLHSGSDDRYAYFTPVRDAFLRAAQFI